MLNFMFATNIKIRFCAVIGIALSTVVFVFLTRWLIPHHLALEDQPILSEFYGLDHSLIQQFFIWILHIFRGYLGVSMVSGEAVTEVVWQVFPRTLELILLSFMIGLVLGALLVVLANAKISRFFSKFIDICEGLMRLLPAFLWGMFFLFMVSWVGYSQIFVTNGSLAELSFQTNFYLLESIFTGDWDGVKRVLNDMIIPALALALPFAGVFSYSLRQKMFTIANHDYILLANCRAIERRKNMVSEVLPNALFAIIPIIQLEMFSLMGFSLFIEYLFSYHGLGDTLINAIILRDFPLFQGIFLVSMLFLLGIHMIMDLFYFYFFIKFRNIE